MSAPASPSTQPPQTGGSSNPTSMRQGLKTAGVALMFIGVILFIGGFLHPWTLFTSSPTAPRTVVSSVSQTPTGQCNFAHQALKLTTAAVVFNPNAVCKGNFSVRDGAIELDGPTGSIIMQPHEKRADLADMWFETARAVDGHATLLYQLIE